MNETKNRTMRLALLTRLWRRHGWLIIGLLWVVALILGYIGFARNAAATGQPARRSTWPTSPSSSSP